MKILILNLKFPMQTTLLWAVLLGFLINSVCSIGSPIYVNASPSSSTTAIQKSNSTSKNVSTSKPESNSNPESSIGNPKSNISFETCIGDLKQIMKTLLIDDLSGSKIVKRNTKSNNNKSNSKSAKVKPISSKNNINDKHLFEYDLSDLAKQSIEVCAPDLYGVINGNLQAEIKTGNYPKSCFISLDINDKTFNNNDLQDCFDLLLRIEKQARNNHLLKEKLLTVNTNNVKNENQASMAVRRLRKGKKGRPTPHRPSPLQFVNNSDNDDKEDEPEREWIPRSQIIHQPVGKVTRTIHQTFIHVSTVPTVIHEIVTRTRLQKSISTVTTTKSQTYLSVETTIVQQVSSVTKNLIQMKVSVVTKTVGKKTVVKSQTVTSTTFIKYRKSTTPSITLPAGAAIDERIVDANYLLGDPDTLITTTLVTFSRLPYISRLCNALSNVGLACASDTPSTTSSSSLDNVSTIVTTTPTTTTTTATRTSVSTRLTTTTTPTTTTSTKTKAKVKYETTTKVKKITKFIRTKTETEDCEETFIPPPPDDCDDNFPPPPDDCDNKFLPPPPFPEDTNCGHDLPPPTPPDNPDCDDDMPPPHGFPDEVYDFPDDENHDRFFLDDEFYYVESDNKRIKKARKKGNRRQKAATRDVYMNGLTNETIYEKVVIHSKGSRPTRSISYVNNTNSIFRQYNNSHHNKDMLESKAINEPLVLGVFEELAILIVFIIVLL